MSVLRSFAPAILHINYAICNFQITSFFFRSFRAPPPSRICFNSLAGLTSAVGKEMLLKNILYFQPRLSAFPPCEFADSFDDPHADPDLKPAALFRSQLGPVFPDTLCPRHQCPPPLRRLALFSSCSQGTFCYGYSVIALAEPWFVRQSLFS